MWERMREWEWALLVRLVYTYEEFVYSDRSSTVQQKDRNRTGHQKNNIQVLQFSSVLLKSTIISTVLSSVKLQDSQLLNLLSVIRLVTILNQVDQCGVVCKLQELDRGVFRCAVIRVQGEEQWGENTALRSSSADRTGAGWEFSQPHYLLLSVRTLLIQWQMEVGTESCVSLWVSGMMVLKAELKSTNRILT